MIADRAQARHDAIVDAAERIFAAKGFHDAGIADIAADLGIGHGTFYRYFKNKQDIAATVLERVVGQVGAAALAEDPRAADTVEDYRAQTGRILAGMFEIVEEHPQVMQFFHAESSAVDAHRLAAAFDGYAAYTEKFLRNGVDKGFLRAGLDVAVTAQLLVALMHEGTRRALIDRDVACRWMVAGTALMFDGISAR